MGDAAFSGKAKDTTCITASTTTKLSTLFKLDIASGGRVYRPSKAPFDSDAYVSEQVFYKSKDGTEVPMIITHRADLDPEQVHPTILYGYGGFKYKPHAKFLSAMAACLGRRRVHRAKS